MSASSFDYDLLVIGSGPAGQKAAVQGAKLGKRIGLVVDTVFNYPILAEGYKVAALDASNKIAALARLGG